MASRMERYYKEDNNENARSAKNKSLYDQIKDLDTYSNIEGVATIEKTNEIDISKVQELIKNRENYKKQRELKGILKEEIKELDKIEETLDETRNYDIKDLLDKIKDENINDVKSRSLNDDQIKTLRSLRKSKKTYDIDKEEEELKELINTISSNKLKEEVQNEDVGLLDELKSDTMVGTAASIKKIIDDERSKKEEIRSELKDEIDKSFYTSSLGFTKSDFEELKDMNHKIKKSNKFIIVLLAIIIALIIGVIIFFVMK